MLAAVFSSGQGKIGNCSCAAFLPVTARCGDVQRGKVSMIPKITHRKSTVPVSHRSRRLVADGRKRCRGGWGGQPMAPEPQPGVCA